MIFVQILHRNVYAMATMVATSNQNIAFLNSISACTEKIILFNLPLRIPHWSYRRVDLVSYFMRSRCTIHTFIILWRLYADMFCQSGVVFFFSKDGRINHCSSSWFWFWIKKKMKREKFCSMGWLVANVIGIFNSDSIHPVLLGWPSLQAINKCSYASNLFLSSKVKFQMLAKNWLFE